MKVLHVIHSLNPEGGGPIEGIKQLAEIHQELGHSVEVVSLDAPDAAWVKSFPLPIHPLGPSWLNYGYTSRLVPWLRAHHADYDVVVVNGIWQYNSLGVWRALRSGSTPYCVFTHGMLDPWFKRRYPLKHFKKLLYWHWAEYRVLRDADLVLFTAEEERILARQSFSRYRCNEKVVNYGTSGPSGNAVTQRALFLEKFTQLVGKRIILFLGRIHEKKGCDLLLHAFAQVLKAETSAAANLHLVMAGPDQSDFANELKKCAAKNGLKDRITWTGMLSGDLKWGAFYSADAFILPSHQENFGISVAEALACGVPVLISNKVNIWREIAEDKAGLVESDDEEGVFRLLDGWLQCDDSAKAAMRLRARRCFTGRFEIRKAAESLLEVLTQMVDSHRKSL